MTLPANVVTAPRVPSDPATKSPPLGFFERYLTVWVALCIVAGIALGQLAPGLSQALGRMEIAHVNVPVGILIWAMIVPMLVKIDFTALHEVRRHARGIGVTLFINWAVKPFSMALLAWLFIRHLFAPLLPAGQIDSYIAGLILLAAAPCTAMVFVWSNLTDGEPNFTLTQVALNDTIMIFAFAPIVALLLGVSSIQVPWATLFLSVVIYILVPLMLAQAWRRALLQARRGRVPANARAHCAVLADGTSRDDRAVVRIPRRGDSAPAPRDRAACRADPAPGAVQLGAGLLAQPTVRCCALRRRTFGADRRVAISSNLPWLPRSASMGLSPAPRWPLWSAC